MADDRVLLIGCRGAIQNMRTGGLFEKVNLSEFHTIIVDSQNISNEINAQFQVDTNRVVPKIKFLRVVSSMQSTFDNLLSWVKNGNNLIIFTSPLPSLYLAEDLIGGSRKISSFAPFSWFDSLKIKGQLVQYVGPESLAGAISEWLPHFHYDIVLGDTQLSPLLAVSASKPSQRQVVGGYRRHGTGVVMFLPPLPELDDPSYHVLLGDLVSLAALLPSDSFDLPIWTEKFRLPEEDVASRNISELQKRVQDIEDKIIEQEALAREDAAWKELFAGTGAGFAECVKRALGELGFKVVDEGLSRCPR